VARACPRKEGARPGGINMPVAPFPAERRPSVRVLSTPPASAAPSAATASPARQVRCQWPINAGASNPRRRTSVPHGETATRKAKYSKVTDY
jgi:hypothetical protein